MLQRPKINGYSLLRDDHPNNIKRGGVRIYFKESLPEKYLKSRYLSITHSVIFSKQEVSRKWVARGW